VLWAYPTTLKNALYLANGGGGGGIGNLARPRFLITSSEVMEPVFRERLLADAPGMEIVDI
ncbi:MAG: hypothetical protein ABIZ80_00405, partial [Bryobacteraceae bacterium]